MEGYSDQQLEFKSVDLGVENEISSTRKEWKNFASENSREPEDSDLSGTTFVSPTQPRDFFQTFVSGIRKSEDIGSIESKETEGGDSVVYVSERPILLERVRAATPAPKPWYSPSRLLLWFLTAVGVLCLAGIVLVILHEFGVLRIGEEGPVFEPAPAPKSTLVVVIDAPTVASSSPMPVETVKFLTVGGGIAKGRADMVVMVVVAILCMLLGTVVGW